MTNENTELLKTNMELTEKADQSHNWGKSNESFTEIKQELLNQHEYIEQLEQQNQEYEQRFEEAQ